MEEQLWILEIKGDDCNMSVTGDGATIRNILSTFMQGCLQYLKHFEVYVKRK